MPMVVKGQKGFLKQILRVAQPLREMSAEISPKISGYLLEEHQIALLVTALPANQ
jgi:hypothetical protein